ncbi:MAG: hypothetical protein QOI04_1594 [Verrucomicrobiota bacterium]|jgi:hypothetical protein
MQVSWRRLGPGETDLELLWLSVSLGGLVVAAAWMTLHLPWPHCFFLAVTGHPCVGCGGTRAAIAFFHGDFIASSKWNPLAFVFLCGVALFDVYAAVVLVARVPRLRVKVSGTEKIFARSFVIALLAANWIYLLSRPPQIF